MAEGYSMGPVKRRAVRSTGGLLLSIAAAGDERQTGFDERPGASAWRSFGGEGPRPFRKQLIAAEYVT